MASKLLKEKYEQYCAVYEYRGGIIEVVDALMAACRVAIFTEKDIEFGLEVTAKTKEVIEAYIKKETNGGDFWTLEHYGQDYNQHYEIVDKMYEVFKYESFWKFDSYMYYMEKKRNYEKRFYYPRRKSLGVVVQDLEDLENDNLDTYGLSMPARVGKSTIMIFFLTWVGMKKPGSHNIMGGHSGTLVKRFFRGLENLVETDEYTFQELFFFWNPKMRKCVQKKSSDPAELSINLGKPDEFPTFSCRSFEATWTGSLDTSDDGYFYVDDLIKDREHSLSAPRVEATYQDYQSKLDRTNDGSKKILVGTLWTVADPLVREERLNIGNDRARFRKIPALNENDESNFQYEYKGFSTEYYREMRERLDRAEWLAKYQQTPIVRESLAFPIEELSFVEDVPDDYRRVIAFCDPAFGSGDSCSMPILADYGEDGIVIGWLHDKRVPDITVPRIVEFIIKYHIMWLQIEKNRGGDLFGEKIRKEMDKQGVHFCKLTFKNANVKMSKEDRISGYSGYIKRHFSFLKKQDTDYKKAIDEVTVFSVEGKNLNDDAPDSLTGLAEMKDEGEKKKARIFGSLF